MKKLVYKRTRSHRSDARKLATDRTITIGVNLDRIEQRLREGCEIRLGSEDSGVRLFPCFTPDFKEIKVVAQTFGEFRDRLKDAEWEEAEGSEGAVASALRTRERCAKKERDAWAAKRLSVTPDTVVTCPNCGTEFRVGKKLA